MRRFGMMAALAVVTGVMPAWAAAPLPAIPAGREVLVLIDGREGTDIRGQGLPTAIETVLNHLGLVVRYHDLAEGLPDEAASRRPRAVVTVLGGSSVPNAAAYARWLADRQAAHQSLVIIGGLGMLQDSRTGALTPPGLWKPVLRGLGVDYDGAFFNDPTQLAVAERGPATTYERPWQDRLPPFVGARCVDPAASVWLRLRRQDTGATSDMGVVGPGGALALDRDCLIFANPVTYNLQWRVDPFWFFGEALALKGQPRLDTTTVNGRRAFYAHIDGDGFGNVSHLPGHRLAAEVVRDEILRRTTLPTTVSVIAGEMAGQPRLQAVARSIFALPRVEAASHSYRHPHDWEAGTLAAAGEAGDGGNVVERKPADPLRPTHEVDDSLALIRTLLPSGKSVALMLWSGRTNPTAAYLERCAALGVPNLNGGDARLDPARPSIGNLAPLGRWAGPHLQVYASAGNENIYTNLWTGPFDGQLAALDLFRQSESPRRLLPVNIYYHFYSGERHGGLRALKGLYGWAEKQPLAPIPASRYARVVEGFYRGRLEAVGPDAWSVQDNGACHTVRFDDDSRRPDWSRCRGVIGYRVHQGALYVHLQPGPATVALAAAPAVQPYLEEANAPVSSWKHGAHGFAGTFEAAVPLTVTLAGFAPRQTVRLAGDWHDAVQADATGRVSLTGTAGRPRLEVAW